MPEAKPLDEAWGALEAVLIEASLDIEAPIRKGKDAARALALAPLRVLHERVAALALDDKIGATQWLKGQVLDCIRDLEREVREL